MALTLNGTTGLSGIAGSAGTPVLQGNNDANTGYFFGTDTLGLSTAGTERLRITSTGAVSINDTTPETFIALQVKNHGGSNACQVLFHGADMAQIILRDETGGTNTKCTTLRNDQGNLLIGTHNDSYGGFSSKLQIGSDGKIGIGTTSPSDALEISHASDPAIRLHYGSNSGYSVLSIDSSNNLTLDVDASAAGSNSFCNLKIDGSEKLRITSDGAVGIGSTSPGTSSKVFSYQGDASAGNNIILENNYSANGTTTLLKAYRQGGAVGYALQYKDSDTRFRQGCYTNHAMELMTNDNARLTLHNDGHARFSNAISFNNETATANRLDDYEEGTWTPSLSFGGGSTGMSISKQTGYYVKIGRLVNLGGTLILSAKGSSTGAAALGGLPFNVGNFDSSTSAEGGGFFTYWINMNSDKLDWTLRGSNNSSTADISVSRSGGHTQIDGATEGDFQSTSSIRFVMTYQA